MTKRDKIILGSGIALAAVVGYIIYNRQQKKKLIVQINKILDDGTGATGTIDDIQNKLTTTLDPKKVFKDSPTIVSRAYANIKTAKGGLANDDEEKVYSALRTLRSFEEFKLLNKTFYAKDGMELIAFLKTFLDSTELGIANGIIGNLR